MDVGGTKATPLPARRSPRLSSQRDTAFTKTLSPLVISRTTEKRGQTQITTVTDSFKTGIGTVSKEKAEVKGYVATQGIQVIELRRSPRVKTPKETDSYLRKEISDNSLPPRSVEKTENAGSSIHTNAFAVTVVTNNTSEVLIERIKAAGTSSTNNLIPDDGDTANDFSPSLSDISNKSRGRFSDSLQVRELRKIEDYWTRKSPSTEQSPRLRSSSRGRSNPTDELPEKDTDIKERKINHQNKDNVGNDSDIRATNDITLPESPVPRRVSARLKSHEIQSSRQEVHASLSTSPIYTKHDSKSDQNDETKVFISASPNLDGNKHRLTQNSKITMIRINSYDEKLEEITSESPTRTVITRSKANIDGDVLNPKEKFSKSPEKDTIADSDPLTGIIIKDFTESDSDDDDDYIPPRKKLRSEVSTEELWEGFPSFSFKRLAPIRKSGESDQCKASVENTPNTSAESDEVLKDVPQKPETHEFSGNESQEKTVVFTDCLSLTPVKVSYSVDKKNSANFVSETLENNSNLLTVSHVGLATKQDYGLVADKEKMINSPSSKIQFMEKIPVFNAIDCAINTIKKTSSKKRKYNVSPNVSLKRSARLQEKQGTSPLNSIEFQPKDLKSNDCERPQSAETKTSTSPETDQTNTEMVIKDDNISKSVLPSKSQDNEEQSTYTEYTQIKEDTREMSILEILSHDFSEKLSSSSSTMASDKSSVSDYNKVTTKVINDSDIDSDLDNSQANETLSSDIRPQESDDKATESVSHTLFSLLQANGTYRKVKETEGINSIQIQNKDIPQPPMDDLLNNIERDHSIKTHTSDTLNAKVSDKTDFKASSSDSSTCSSEDKGGRHVAVKVEKLKMPRISCSTSNSDVTVKGNDNGSTKKDIPPLRIKLKPKSGHLKKKDLKKKKVKAKLQDKETDSKTRKESSNSTVDIPGAKDKSNKSKMKTSGEQTEQPQDETTPKTKKSKKSVSKRRKSSPNPSNMELRLNNERRISVADEILSNPMLDKHACVIWSSENRRHIVLSKPDASHADIDDILRLKWEKLSDKEKLRYFQRAMNAIKDENRHSTRRREEVPKPAEATPSTSADPNPSLTKFIMMNPGQQLTELKKWLHFYHDVSVEEYNNVLTGFKETLQKEKAEKEKETEADNAKSKMKSKAKKKSKGSKQSKEDLLFDDFDARSRYRKLLFEKIFVVKDKVLKIWRETKEKQKEKMKENFSGIVKKLITGDNVDFSGNVVSGRLTEVLSDIKNLETSRKLGVSGKELQSESFVDLVNNLKQELENVHPQQSASRDGDDEPDKVGECNDNDAQCQDNSVQSVGDLPQLNPTSVQEVFNEINNTYSHQGRLKPSPSSLLTSWVVADLLEDQVAQEEAQRNINNNMSHTAPYTQNNREFRSILNLEDLQRKYGTKLQNGAETNVVSSDAYLRSAGFRNMENSTSVHTKASVPQRKLVNLSNHCISSSRSGIVALQHYDNGRSVVRYARVKPGAYSAAQLRLLGQRQKMRFTPQVGFTELASRAVNEERVENKDNVIARDRDGNEANATPEDETKTQQNGREKN